MKRLITKKIIDRKPPIRMVIPPGEYNKIGLGLIRPQKFSGSRAD